MIKNIFFDFNGTLLDDVNICLTIEQEMMAMEGIKPYSKEEYLALFKFPVLKYYSEVGFAKNRFLPLADYFNSEYAKRWENNSKLFPSTKETLLKLKSEGYKLYCLSASPYDFLVDQLKILDIFDIFDGICGAKNNLAFGKIEYGKIFIKENNINPKETVMVGDTDHDFEVSKAFGFKCILFSQGHNSRRRLEVLNTDLADNYDDILKDINKLNEAK